MYGGEAYEAIKRSGGFLVLIMLLNVKPPASTLDPWDWTQNCLKHWLSKINKVGFNTLMILCKLAQCRQCN